jgi:hypothetical protein
LSDLGGILTSGGPTGFFNDTKIEFVDCSPRYVIVEIIGSGLNIGARLEAFDEDGTSLGTVTNTYTGSTGQPSPFAFLAPRGKTIASVIYNGGLNPNAAASIGTLIYNCRGGNKSPAHHIEKLIHKMKSHRGNCDTFSGPFGQDNNPLGLRW